MITDMRVCVVVEIVPVPCTSFGRAFSTVFTLILVVSFVNFIFHLTENFIFLPVHCVGFYPSVIRLLPCCYCPVSHFRSGSNSLKMKWRGWGRLTGPRLYWFLFFSFPTWLVISMKMARKNMHKHKAFEGCLARTERKALLRAHRD